MRALGFEPKKEEIRKMIADIDKDGSGFSPPSYCMYIHVYSMTLVSGTCCVRHVVSVVKAMREWCKHAMLSAILSIVVPSHEVSALILQAQSTSMNFFK